MGRISKEKVFGIQYLIDYENKTNRLEYLQNSISRNWKIQGPISIDKNQLFDAILKDRTPQKPFILNETPYFLEKFIDMDNPEFRSSSSTGRMINGVGTRSHSVGYDVKTVEILSIEPIEGSVKWTLDLPMKTSFNLNRSTGYFQLSVEEKGKKFSKSRMKIRCQGKELDYIIFKFGESLNFAKEIKE